MILGMTYAKFVAIVLGGMVGFQPAEHPASKDSQWLVTAGTNGKDKTPVGQEGFITVERRPAEELAWGFKPVQSLGLSVDGAGFIGYGVRKDYRWGDVQLTPFFGPVLYQKSLGNFEAKQLVQFRTGFDVMYNLTPAVGVGVGLYHISNARLTAQSAEIDVTRVTLQFKY
jgi:hypothetical protein